jgi:hypothetical protein
MVNMLRRPFSLFVLFVAFAGLLASTFSLAAQSDERRGRKFRALPPNARIQVLVLRDVNGRAIENAAVIFHLVGDKGNMELKTNDEGKAVLDVLSQGCVVTLQIIARGYQTYGANYKIDKADNYIEVRMKRPGEQYSIYKPHSATESNEPPLLATDAAPRASDSRPADAPAAAPAPAAQPK